MWAGRGRGMWAGRGRGVMWTGTGGCAWRARWWQRGKQRQREGKGQQQICRRTKFSVMLSAPWPLCQLGDEGAGPFLAAPRWILDHPKQGALHVTRRSLHPDDVDVAKEDVEAPGIPLALEKARL